MPYRVPSFAFSQRAIHFSGMHNANILKYQEQITSGLRFHRPSEEPIAYRQVASMNSRFAELSADRSTIDRSTSILNASVAQIQDFTNVITRAKSLTQQGIQSFDDDERNSLAIEVDALLQQLKQIGLAQFNDRYLYGGTRSQDPPFQFSESGGADGSLEVVYAGGSQRSRASVGDSIAVDTYYNGLEIFGSRGREPTVLTGNTGAKTGSGTDTLIGQARLQVAHDTTSFLGASGLQTGTDSGAGDTIIGPPGSYSVTIVDTSGDGSAGTISLNGANPVAFTGTDTNLRVAGSGGQVIFVDTTNIAAGFSGTVDIEATGTLSVDGGASATAIDFTSNQVVVDAATQRAVTIDTTQIRNSGIDDLDFPGTSNAFQVLFDLAKDLRNTRGRDSQDLANSLDRRLGELESIGKNAFAALGEQSASLQTLDSLGFRVDDLMLSIETRISEVQATDLPEAILRLENSQALLQYTYAVTAELTSIGILDFLR